MLMLPDMSFAPVSAELRGNRLVLSDLPTVLSPFSAPAVTMSFGESHSFQAMLGVEESSGFMVDTLGGVAGYVQAGGRHGIAAGVSEGVQLGLSGGTVLDQAGLYVGATVEAGVASFGATNSGLSLGLGVGNMAGVTGVMGVTHVMPIVEPWQFELKLNYNMMVTPLPNSY